MLRRAVREFMWRRVFARPPVWIAVALLAGWALWLAMTGAAFYAGLVAGALLCCSGLVAMVWQAHRRNTLGRFRAMDPPEADLWFEDGGLRVVSNLGTATVPWERFSDVWDLPDACMLILGDNQFMTVPRDGVPPEAFALVRDKVAGRAGYSSPKSGNATSA